MNSVNLDRLYFAYKLLIDAAEKTAAGDSTAKHNTDDGQNTTGRTGSTDSLPAAADSRQPSAGGGR